jgi:cell division septum initiation protein DivIVA
MTHPKITEIQGKLTQGMSGLSREDVEWLLNRVEELEKENEWLKKEVAYGEHQGEVGS